MTKTQPVKPPSRYERFMLQVMIIIGVVSMLYFVYNLLMPAYVGYKTFYWILMFAVGFKCLKVLHEWYHYFFISIPKKPEGNKDFTVDILTTFCPGEPYEMIEETLRAIQSIRYPHTTYLGDEGNDPHVRALCESLGVIHVTRNNRVDAKAGNINNILQIAKGDLCVVLDPDHVPAPEFLDRVVKHFNDPKIGYVQIVQAYKNLDESLVAKGAAQQTFQFYGPMMMTMNRYGTVMAIGANCTFRRAALDSIGGHAPGLAEDMHTAMQLHAKGWKSVYVPEVLTRGLVPSTLSAYYKQQLKWARGTFELLFTTYPKLFSRFTWSQRLHYGTLPFHYFSGVICLINFLIPILSLVLGVIPLKVDLLTFAIVGFPFAVSVTMIRHYVQRWVMEEEERGFHLVGGILLIGTWWIYILGLVYTIVRKKVPYIPTPKDAKTRDGWAINIPNIVIALLSAGAIVYGLITDWNPYSIFMAFVTSLNIAFMVFTIYASRQEPKHLRIESWSTISGYSRAGKRLFWLFRHQLYSVIRALALPALLCVMAFTIYAVKRGSEMPASEPVHQVSPKILYRGIFHPTQPNGLTNMSEVKRIESSSNVHFDLVSLYIPWGADERSMPPAHLIDSIYNNNATPFITWEPWTNNYPNTHNLASKNETMVDIHHGAYDDYVKTFAEKLKALNRPVFLRFAHEFDNPAYPWYSSATNAPDDFKKAWIHVHQLFENCGAGNVIWVWSPWKAVDAEAYFPGAQHVDWLSVTALDYAPNGNSESFLQRYAPFHALDIFQSGLPVMLSETGTLKADHREAWLANALAAIDTTFKEIKGCILFNSALDQNIIPGVTGDLKILDWSVKGPIKVPNHQSTMHTEVLTDFWTVSERDFTSRPDFLKGVKGVNFSKGKNWFKNFHALTKKEITADLRRMKSIGINTIKRYGPGIYDRNVMAAVESEGMRLYYNFWIEDQIDVLQNADKLTAIEAEILNTVRNFKDNKCILAWNINNQLWHHLKERYPKPELFYHQQQYLFWMAGLVHKIKAIDQVHPVTIDLPVSANVASDLAMLRSAIRDADSFGLTLEDDTFMKDINALKEHAFLSEIPVDCYIRMYSADGVFISEWQDLWERNIITVNGLIDHWGRPKTDYFVLAHRWANSPSPLDVAGVKILRPAIATVPGYELTYHALRDSKGLWEFADPSNNTRRYEWYLLKTDGFGNNTFLKKLGTGPAITITIPEDPLTFKLYLLEITNGRAKSTISSLNTPLFK